MTVGLGLTHPSSAQEVPPGCEGVGISVVMQPTGPVKDGDTIEYVVTVQIPPASCTMTALSVRFWPPDDPPDEPFNICNSTNGVVLAFDLTLQPNEVVVFDSLDDPALSYVVNHDDEVRDPAAVPEWR